MEVQPARQMPITMAALRIADMLGDSTSRIVSPNRLCASLADLHGYLAPLRSRFHGVRGIEAEDVLRADLVLDVGVDSAQLHRSLDVVRVAAGLAAELAEFVADVDLGAVDSDSDRIDLDGRA